MEFFKRMKPKRNRLHSEKDGSRGATSCKSGDPEVTMFINEDLTNVAFWIYKFRLAAEASCSSVEGITPISEEQKAKLRKLVKVFISASLVLIILQSVLAMMICKDLYSSYSDIFKKVKIFGDKNSMEVLSSVLNESESLHGTIKNITATKEHS